MKIRTDQHEKECFILTNPAGVRNQDENHQI